MRNGGWRNRIGSESILRLRSRKWNFFGEKREKSVKKKRKIGIIWNKDIKIESSWMERDTLAQAYKHTHACRDTHTHAGTHTRRHTHTHTHTQTHAHTHTHIHTHARTHTDTHTHTHFRRHSQVGKLAYTFLFHFSFQLLLIKTSKHQNILVLDFPPSDRIWFDLISMFPAFLVFLVFLISVRSGDDE